MSTAAQPIHTIPGLSTADLPQPQGKFILVRMRKLDERINPGSSLIAPRSRTADEEIANPLADVILVGPECFAGLAAPYCKPGDTILMAPYSGQSFRVGETLEADEYRIIADYVVTAVVPRPEIVRRSL